MRHDSKRCAIQTWTRRAVVQRVAGGATTALLATNPTRGDDPPRDVVMVVYPGFTALDLVGPHHVLSALPGHRIHLVAKELHEIRSDTGLALRPTRRFADCPESPQILFVPGGTAGTLEAMDDPDLVAFVERVGSRAAYVTSVCTGALVLGAAGLLRGYKATTHWLVRDLLPVFGAEAVPARVVEDRGRVTGGGVTAGLDFGLRLAARIQDEPFAKAVQLIMEYDPRPPFRAGTPEAAGVETSTMVRSHLGPFVKAARAAAERAARRQRG